MAYDKIDLRLIYKNTIEFDNFAAAVWGLCGSVVWPELVTSGNGADVISRGGANPPFVFRNALASNPQSVYHNY